MHEVQNLQVGLFCSVHGCRVIQVDPDCAVFEWDANAQAWKVREDNTYCTYTPDGVENPNEDHQLGVTISNV